MNIKSQILTQIIHSGPLSRAQLSRLLNISPSRITEVTATLLSQGILHSVGVRQDKSRGRKSILLDLDCSYKFALGIGIHDGVLSVGITTVKGEVLSHDYIDYISRYRIVEDIISSIHQLMTENSISYDRLLGFGLCAEAPLATLLAESLQDFANDMGVPLLTEPAEQYLIYAQKYLPINPRELYKFGCAKVIRDVFINE